ncbi:MAG: hypothetical protein JW928_02230 [Candidatus Aureabacteria bacterium]|nr:hypothetical protein [Candidatus Auribacterota bacterium]
MKRIVLLVALFSFFIQLDLFSDTYMTLGGGTGGDAGGNNFSFDFGGFTEDDETNALMAVGLTYISGVDELPDGTLGDMLTSGFTLIGDRQKDKEIGLYGKLGAETIEKLFIFATAGFSFVETAEIARSNTTGLYHEQTSDTNIEGLFGAGLICFLKDKNFGFQLEYDNRRGVTGSLAFRF